MLAMSHHPLDREIYQNRQKLRNQLHLLQEIRQHLKNLTLLDQVYQNSQDPLL